MKKLGELIPGIPPEVAWPICDYLETPPDAPEFLRALCRYPERQGRNEIFLQLGLEAQKGFGIDITPLVFLEHEDTRGYTALYAALTRMPQRHVGWLPFILVYEFFRNPGQQTLSNVLKKCVDGGWQPSQKSYISRLPWPLAACLEAVQSVQELQLLADQVEKGLLGDIDEWRIAEQRWNSQGIIPEEITQRPMGLQPFDSSIANRGDPPYWGGSVITSHNYSDALLRALCSLAEQLPSGSKRESIVWFLCLASENTGGIARCIDPSRLRALIEERDAQHWWHENVVGYPEQPEVVASWLEFFDWLGRSDVLSPYGRSSKFNDVWSEAWQRAFISNPAQHGLLRLLGRLATAGYAFATIPTVLLDLGSFPEPRFQLAALLVRLTQPSLTEENANYLADAVAALLDPPAELEADELLFATAEGHLDSVPALAQFLLRLHERMPPGVEFGQSKCERLLRQALRRRASDLHLPGQLQKLQLPMVV